MIVHRQCAEAQLHSCFRVRDEMIEGVRMTPEVHQRKMSPELHSLRLTLPACCQLGRCDQRGQRGASRAGVAPLLDAEFERSERSRRVARRRSAEHLREVLHGRVVPDEDHRRGALGQTTRDRQQVIGIGRIHRVVIADWASQDADQRLGGRLGARGRRTHHEVDLPAGDVAGDHLSCPLSSSVERPREVSDRGVRPIRFRVTQQTQSLHRTLLSFTRNEHGGPPRSLTAVTQGPPHRYFFLPFFLPFFLLFFFAIEDSSPVDDERGLSHCAPAGD